MTLKGAAVIFATLGAVACQQAPAAAPQAASQPPAQVQQVRKAIRPEKSPNTGLPYSPGVLAGNTLYISGHLGRDPVTGQLVAGGIEAETRQSLANIREVLAAAGMDLNDV